MKIKEPRRTGRGAYAVLTANVEPETFRTARTVGAAIPTAN